MLVRADHAPGVMTKVAEGPRVPDSPDCEQNDDTDAQIIASLERSGLAPDIARIVVRDARARNPDSGGLDLLGEVMDIVRQRGPAAKRPVSEGRQPLRRVRTPPIDGDLRAIVGLDGAGGYDALLAAGVIKPPATESWIHCRVPMGRPGAG